uniref:Uncharacterized protein n=1 Tax=Myoviridae sp. ctWb16 TaxID=2827690 RepID=A0A8S5T107_9CAUD|nr:MAG TPA: hypothetical protein [Myoviridae sp. ctWb16]
MKNVYLSDKYFTSLDDFNKDLIAHKSNFFKDYQGFPFISLLNALSYNTDFNTKNYRWGKRYFNMDNKDFYWITSNENKKINKSFWNKDTFSYVSKEINAYFTDVNIKEHFLSCFKPHRKINFFYKLSKNEQNELKNYSTSLQNLYMVSDKTYGSSQQIGTDILLIDIDNYEDRHALETLNMFLDFVNLKINDLIFIEQNAFTGGIHTALKLPQVISNINFYPTLMKELQKNDIRIECNFINTILRFPLSFEYVAIQKDERILNYDEFIPTQFWENTFADYLNNLNDNVCNSNYLNDLILKTHNLQPVNIWENYWKTKKNLFKKNQSIVFNNEIYKIEKGKRYESMSKIIPYCKLQGMSLDETVNTIFDNNIDSKDLLKWSREKLKKNIEKFFNKCPEQAFTTIKNYNKSFISNLEKLPTITQDFLNNKTFNEWFTNRFIKFYMEERNKHNNSFNSFSTEKIEILNKQIPYFLKEIIGKMFYEINANKEFINEEFNAVLGFQISDTYLKALQEQSISDLELSGALAKTSLQYLKKALIKALSLTEIKYKNRTRNWMLGSCKSFRIKNTNDLYNLLNHLFRSCFNNIYNKEFRINKSELNNLLILYIQLVEKYDIVQYDEVNFIIEAIPKYET